jgi:hypothetical protein
VTRRSDTPPPWLLVVLLAVLASSLVGLARSCDRESPPRPVIEGEWQ